METRRIPLFPLNVVLFPGSRLPIRIFEERYKRLYEDSLKGGAEFGVVLIKEGQEVGPTAVPHDVGTTAEIEAVDYRKDSIFLLLRGVRRFRITDLDHDRPYLQGAVEFLHEPSGDLPATEAAAGEHVMGLWRDYLDRMQRVSKALWGGELKVPAPRPERPLVESLRGIAFSLALDPGEKQQLLEETRMVVFIEKLRLHLERELEFLRQDAPSTQT